MKYKTRKLLYDAKEKIDSYYNKEWDYQSENYGDFYFNSEEQYELHKASKLIDDMVKIFEEISELEELIKDV